MRVWRPPGLTRPAQALPVPYASSATWRIPSTPVEFYRPLLRVPLTDGVGQAVVSGGTATVTVGPQGLGTRWYPVKVDIATSSGPADTSTLQLFLGTTALANLIASTSYTAGGDTFGLSGSIMDPGDYLIGVWSGAHNGDVATLRITGHRIAMVA